MKITNPADGTTITEVTADNATAVQRKYELARAGQPKWAKVPLKKRLAIIAAFRERIVAMQETLARTLTHEVGKPIRQSRNELNGLLGRIDFFLAESARDAARREGVRRCGAKARGADRPRAARRHRQHLGLELSVLRRRQRLRAGAPRRQRRPLQAVGIRDAHRDAHCRAAARGRRPARRVRAGDRRRRDRRGAPAAAGRRRVLHGIALHRRQDRRPRRRADDQGAARAGRQGSRSTCARTSTSPLRPPRVADGAFYNTGQSCCSVERIYVHEKIHDAFVRASCRRSPRLQVGRPDGRDDLHRRHHAAPAARRAEKAGRRRQTQGRAAPPRRQHRQAQGQLVRADRVRRRRPFDVADEGRKLRPDHRHPGRRR